MAVQTMVLIEADAGRTVLARLVDSADLAEQLPSGTFDRTKLRTRVCGLRVRPTQESEVVAAVRRLDGSTADQVTVRRARVSEGRMPWRARA